MHWLSTVFQEHLPLRSMAMQRKIIVYIAASLDGYIATKDDSLG